MDSDLQSFCGKGEVGEEAGAFDVGGYLLKSRVEAPKSVCLTSQTIE